MLLLASFRIRWSVLIDTIWIQNGLPHEVAHIRRLSRSFAVPTRRIITDNRSSTDKAHADTAQNAKELRTSQQRVKRLARSHRGGCLFHIRVIVTADVHWLALNGIQLIDDFRFVRGKFFGEFFKSAL